jgi:Restriction endonuclease BsobI
MSKMIPPHKAHLKASADLVTTYEQRRAGFVALALERNERATPFVDRARALKVEASKVARPADLLTLVDCNG